MRLINRAGWEVRRFRPQEVGASPLHDMLKFVPPSGGPMIFDVGANSGQTVKRLRRHYANATIHSFEPSPAIYALLLQNVADMHGVFTWNVAVGSAKEVRTLYENSRSKMTSLLDLGPTGWGEVERRTAVEVVTIDGFCSDREIGHIDILKTDTQGNDLSVLEGARDMLSEQAVSLVLTEIIFSDMYEGMSPYYRIFEYMDRVGYSLVSIYPLSHRGALASWSDALFISPRHYAEVTGGRSEPGDGMRE